MYVLQIVPKEILLLEDVVHILCRQKWLFIFLVSILIFFFYGIFYT
jgi:hypothetical protein